MPQKNSDQFEQTKTHHATVAETGEKVLVDNVGVDIDNPWGFYSEMWHKTADGRVFHDDELIFLKEQQ